MAARFKPVAARLDLSKGIREREMFVASIATIDARRLSLLPFSRSSSQLLSHAPWPSRLIMSGEERVTSAMGYMKDQLLARLQELQIEFSKYKHPVILTIEAQAKYLGNVGASFSKNLFLKDKRQRFYIVSALADTKVDLKGIQPVIWFNEFLGLGKGGLRMAPEEALGEIIQVPLGCATPFALVNEWATLNTSSLDTFLKSIGRDRSYVDLEPPDLAALVPSDSIVLPEFAGGALTSEHSNENHAATDVKPKAVKAKAVKTPTAAEKVTDKSSTGVLPSISFTDAGQFVEEILGKTSAIVLPKIQEDIVRQHGEQLGAVVSDTLRNRLSSELKNLAVSISTQDVTSVKT